MGTGTGTRTCGNCAVAKHCFYRGIINPCDEHQIDRMHADLRRKAREVVGHPLSFEEGQFVTSAATLEFFSPKQAGWLRSIHKRFDIN